VKEMEKSFVGVISGAVVEDVVKCVLSALDFIYYAQLRKHSNTTLAAMDKALDDFHSFKDIFVRLGIRDHFNIPKLHALVHYVLMIRSLGCADGYNTEASERLHIDYAKDAYRATNRRAYTQQMTKWLSRQEAADQFDAYLQWRSQQDQSPSLPRIGTSDAVLSSSPMANARTSSSRPIPSPYNIAAKPPLQKVPVRRLVHDYGATSFLQALNTYLQSRQDVSGALPSELDTFDVYKSFDIPLAPISALSETSVPGTQTISVDKVRAIPGIHQNTLTSSAPGHGKFDTVLVKMPDSAESECTKGTALTSKLSVMVWFGIT
jgi:hypothetical protein